MVTVSLFSISSNARRLSERDSLLASPGLCVGVHFIQFAQDLVSAEVFASSPCFVAGSQGTGNKGLLRPPVIDADPQGLLDEAGQGGVV